jgi:hypothetical protein
MNLRARNITVKPDTLLGVQDKDLTNQAPKQDGRASRVRHYCECSKPATLHRCNAYICEDCAATDSETTPNKAGVPERDPGHVGWRDVRAACIGFMIRNGMRI